MRIDLPAKDSWYAVSEQFRAALPFQVPMVIVQIYSGYTSALLEVTQGLTKLYSHKKTIAYVKGAEPVFEAVALPLSAEGYTVKGLTAADLEDTSTWLPEAERDLLFVLIADDDPVTGRLHDNQKLLEALKDKRIFRIHLSHAAHKQAPITRPHQFEVRLLSLAAQRALLVAGERCRIIPPITSALPWVLEAEESVHAALRPEDPADMSAHKSSIESFEASLPAGFERYFGDGVNRIYDRSVFYHRGIDGSALIFEVAGLLGLPVGSPGEPSALEATSPCRWENPRFAVWLMQRGESEEVVRGLVVADRSIVGPKLKEALAQAADRILRLQNGE